MYSGTLMTMMIDHTDICMSIHHPTLAIIVGMYSGLLVTVNMLIIPCLYFILL